ncbi:hypothetical protein TrRE_jg6323 [Triparma retinervis]|uniref:Importin N-terminal domain-containing protein n=1 Tax=Triparma retinervis TaxID=2557542 RepID=A0A9W6ZN64_9STRA|nr:hypothetical protein TrRE_jg6323 [Triparma retinervis]
MELFHAILGLQAVVLKRWESQSSPHPHFLRDFLFYIGIKSGEGTKHYPWPMVPNNSAVAAAAVLWKRSYLAASESQPSSTNQFHPNTSIPLLSSPSDLFQYVRNVLATGTERERSSAAMFLSTLISELNSGAQKSKTNMNQTMDFHKRSQAKFYETGLNPSIELAMTALQTVLTPPYPTPAYIGKIIELVIDVLSWEFSPRNSWTMVATSSQALIKPPAYLAPQLIKPDLLRLIFTLYHDVRANPEATQISHQLRQLILSFASLSGQIFESDHIRASYSTIIVDGMLSLLSASPTDPSELQDIAATCTRLISNFKLKILSQLPSFGMWISALVNLSTSLIASVTASVEAHGGDFDCLDDEWKFEVFDELMECFVLISDDPSLFAPGPVTMETIQNIKSSLSPIYPTTLLSRIKMSRAEEKFYTIEGRDLDEVRESISAADLTDQIINVSTIGRLNFQNSITCFEAEISKVLTSLKVLFNSNNPDVTPDAAALLEEARILIMFAGHLLTDTCPGETATIPSQILEACSSSVPGAAGIVASIASVVGGLMSLGEFQASKIASTPSDPNLSPLLGEQLTSFFTTFASSYVIPNTRDYDSSMLDAASPLIGGLFGVEASAHRFLEFSVSVATHYFCFWPQEKDLMSSSTELLIVLCKNPGTRKLLPNCDSWKKLAGLFIVAGSLSNIGPAPAVDPNVLANHRLDMGLVAGFKRLNYDARGGVLSILTCGCGGMGDAVSKSIMNEILGVAHGVLGRLLVGIEGQGGGADVGENAVAVDMCCLAIELYGGICRSPFAGIVDFDDRGSNDNGESYILTRFVTPSLSKLAGLMLMFGGNMTICAALLRCFKDYSESYIAFLNTVESTALYSASNVLLEGYSTLTKGGKLKRSKEEEEEDEEQEYFDVLCAIQLLNHLGTKEFMDCVDGNNPGSVNDFVSGGAAGAPVEVTDVIFFGISQLLPLVSGLLQYPKLCSQFFDLVGYVVETYPEKLDKVPADFFEGLVGSMLWGMGNVDEQVGKHCLVGIEALAKEHLGGGLRKVIGEKPDTFKVCVGKLLREIVFVHSVVQDRMDSCGGCLMVLIAVDLGYFTNYTIQAGINGKGNVGRQARKLFKKNFQLFVQHVHSFLHTL